MKRRWDLDALRGLMLVLMTLTHMPTRFSEPAGQPFGFVSAAEGFVMLSAFMAGMVYSARARRDGGAVMREAFLLRAGKIYLCQVALLVFLFTFIAFLGVMEQRDAVTHLVSFYLQQPLTAFLASLLLIYSPPLLDILPMYILFMLISPLLLLHALRHGWFAAMAVSVALWLAAQFDIGSLLYGYAVALTGLRVPFQETGAFEILGWQFLWVLGLWMGTTHTGPDAAPPVRFPAWMVSGALVVAVTGLVWRHAVGQTPFPHDPVLNLVFDKWHLGPLRLVNFFALLVLAMRFGPGLAARMPRLRFLEVLGAASLPVFCTHLILALLALALIGEASRERPWWIDVAILAGSFALLYAVALGSRYIDRQGAAIRARAKLRAPLTPGVPRSPSSTAHSPHR